MASTHKKITGARRSDTGKGASRRLRRAGKVPAIIYGIGIPPVNLEFDHEEIVLAAKNEWFFSSVLELEVEGETQPVLVRDWQTHPYRQQMLHLDLMRIDETAEIRVYVPLHFINGDISPAGKASGVVISHNMTDVEVACLAKDLPEHIVVDLAALDEGDLVRLSDLKLPEGVALPALRLGKDYDQTVASARAVKEEVEAPTVAEGEAAAPADGEAPAADAGDAPKGEDK